MRSVCLTAAIAVCTFFAAAAHVVAVECCDCCECCHCGYEMKKYYRPVVEFKRVCYTKYDYCTQCRDVLAPTSTCAPCCKTDCGCCSECGGSAGGCGTCLCGPNSGPCQPRGLGGKICGFFGEPRTIKVPVAVQHKCAKCTRLVPTVTWVVEYKCVKCHHEEKEQKSCLSCLTKGNGH